MKSIIIIILSLLFSFPTFANETNSSFVYFGNESCMECLKTKRYIENIKKEKPYIDYIYHSNLEEKELLHNYYNAYNVPKESYNIIPIIFVNDMYYIGYEDVSNFLNKSIKEDFNFVIEPKTSNFSTESVNNEFFKTFSFFKILFAGLLDGINPCSIAMLLFFISLLSVGQFKKSKILIIGFSYILGIFISYLSIGLGAYKFITILNINWLRIVFISVTVLLTLILSFLSFKDFVLIKKNKYNKVQTQLPKFLKHIIHNVLRKNSNQKYIILTTFFTGIVISLLEFFCTGQIYLPTISYMLSNEGLSNQAFLYLIIYNIAFVLPLILICIALFLGKNILDVSQLLITKLHIIKLVSSIFFLVMTIILLKQLFWII